MTHDVRTRIDTRGLACFDLTTLHLSLTTTAPSNPLLATNRKMQEDKLVWVLIGLN